MSDEYDLFELAERFADWAQLFANVGFKNIPEKPLVKMNDYNQDEIFGFKMTVSFSLELYMKTYCYILLHKKNNYKKFKNKEDLKQFLKSEKLLTHNLKELQNYIVKEDPSFDDDIYNNAINYFDCFEEIRYPVLFKKSKQIIGLFDYNDGMMIAFQKTYEFLRTKCNEYIRDINQKESDELDYESEKARELSEYKYYENNTF